MTINQPPGQTVPDAEYRAAVVAGIRALADLIESNPNLPVPQLVGAQFSVHRQTTEDRIDIVRAAAAELGEEPSINDDTSYVTKALAEGGYPTGLPSFSVRYTVHGNVQHDRPTGGAE